jgi:uncharacterized protein (TIGR02145 family)
MKKSIKAFAVVAAVALAAGFASCKKDGPAVAPVVITIEEAGQPAAPAATLIEGAIPEATKLTVTAAATEGAVLIYQWYGNTTADNTGGTVIEGATTNEFTLPADLKTGTYYYYCMVGAEGATPVATKAVTVVVEFGGMVINGVKWAVANVDAPGKFAATPEAFGMFYQWGKNVGWSTTEPLVASDGGTTWDTAACTDDEWSAESDPCPAGWRVASRADYTALLSSSKVTSKWSVQGEVGGRLFTDKTDATQAIFLPATGRLDTTGARVQLPEGDSDYWSSTKRSAANAYTCYFYNGGAYYADIERTNACPVRCVRR